MKILKSGHHPALSNEALAQFASTLETLRRTITASLVIEETRGKLRIPAGILNWKQAESLL